MHIPILEKKIISPITKAPERAISRLLKTWMGRHVVLITTSLLLSLMAVTFIFWTLLRRHSAAIQKASSEASQNQLNEALQPIKDELAFIKSEQQPRLQPPQQPIDPKIVQQIEANVRTSLEPTLQILNKNYSLLDQRCIALKAAFDALEKTFGTAKISLQSFVITEMQKPASPRSARSPSANEQPPSRSRAASELQRGTSPLRSPTSANTQQQKSSLQPFSEEQT